MGVKIFDTEEGKRGTALLIWLKNEGTRDRVLVTYLDWLSSWSLSLGSQIRHYSLFFVSWQSNRTELKGKSRKKGHVMGERG